LKTSSCAPDSSSVSSASPISARSGDSASDAAIIGAHANVKTSAISDTVDA
jgi:hypothetical protein